MTTKEERDQALEMIGKAWGKDLEAIDKYFSKEGITNEKRL